MTPITRGFVLGGGASRRYGSDKALAPLDGQPAVLALAARLAAAGLTPGVVWRTLRPELGVAQIVEPIEEPEPGTVLRHPLLGLAAIGGDDDVFVCPCDAVDLRPEAIRALVDARAVSEASPLCGVWPAERRQRAREAARAGDSVRSLAAGLPALDVGPIGNRNTISTEPAR